MSGSEDREDLNEDPKVDDPEDASGEADPGTSLALCTTPSHCVYIIRRFLTLTTLYSPSLLSYNVKPLSMYH